MPEDTTPLTADADVPVMPDGYDPEAAARLMWWATTGCYARFKPDEEVHIGDSIRAGDKD